MICLIDTQDTPKVGIITRVSRAHRGYKGINYKDIIVLGMRALYVTIDKTPSMPSITAQNRVKHAAERMRASHAGKVLFSKNFPYRELVLREGFDDIDESLLMETLIGKIVTEFSGRDKVGAFFANRLTGSAERTFCEMCRDFRYVMAALDSDSSRLLGSLSRRLGISVIGQPTIQQLSKADVAVFYSPPRSAVVLPEKCIAIPVSDTYLDDVIYSKAVTGVTFELNSRRALSIPDGFPHEPLFAAAIDAGTLRREDVLLKDIKITDMYV